MNTPTLPPPPPPPKVTDPSNQFEICTASTVIFLILCSQIKTRMENERYLRAHPEVNSLLTGFLR